MAARLLTKCPHHTDDRNVNQIGTDQKMCYRYRKHSKKPHCLYYRPDYNGHCDWVEKK